MIERMFATWTPDEIESALVEREHLIGRLRTEQVLLLGAVDAGQMPLADGCRTIEEWVAGRLDIAPETAATLSRTYRHADPEELADAGPGSFDRLSAMAALEAAGATEETLSLAEGLDVAGVRRLASRHAAHSRADETQTFAQRYLMFQPTLDRLSERLFGQLPACEAEIVRTALDDRADRFPTLPDGSRDPLSQRRADALVALAQDTATTGGSGGTVSVFVDASILTKSAGDAGITTESGTRVGLGVLEAALCGGAIEVNTTGVEPLGVGTRTRVIPPRLARYVRFRDGGCVADGCVSRYRLQAHHVVNASDGGPTEATNLVSLCWFHHHVVIHRQGFTIDPDSAPGRIRFLQPARRAPPH